MTTPERWLEKHNRKLLMDRSATGRIGASLTKLDVPESELPDSALLRDNLDMPEVSESEIVRYFSQLSHYNFSIDHNFYPLGSCTMKYNPKINDEMAGAARTGRDTPLPARGHGAGRPQARLAPAGNPRRGHGHGRGQRLAQGGSRERVRRDGSWCGPITSLAATTSARKC